MNAPDPRSAPLKPALRKLFEDVALSREELAALRQLERPANAGRRRLLLAAASTAGVALLGHGVWRATRGEPVDAVFERLAEVHLASFPLAVEASDLRELQRVFAASGFMLRDSAPLASLGGQLLGARPCHLLERAAAELRFVLPDGGWATVLQAAYVAEVFGRLPDIGHDAEPLTRVLRGLECRVWCDRGVVFAKARAA